LEPAAFLRSGLEANPTSFLLNFAYAEHQEIAFVSDNATATAEKKEELHAIHRRFCEKLRVDLDALEKEHLTNGGQSISQQSSGVPTAPAGPLKLSAEDEDMLAENEIYGILHAGAEEEREKEKERQRKNEQRALVILDKRTELGMASIAWMRVAKRVGQSAGLRATFKEIRSDKWVCWQVFEAAGKSRLPELLVHHQTHFSSSSPGTPDQSPSGRCIKDLRTWASVLRTRRRLRCSIPQLPH
jgi:cleavage stimulation factor subunit 3